MCQLYVVASELFSEEKNLIHLDECLFTQIRIYLALKHGFHIHGAHFPSNINLIATAINANKCLRFKLFNLQNKYTEKHNYAVIV